MKKFLVRSLSVAGLIALLNGCTRFNDDLYLSDTPVVLTKPDPTIDFSQYNKTYYISDRINIVNSEDNDIDSLKFWATYNAAFLNAINQNMQDLGYTKVAQTANPDLVLVASAIATTNTGGYWYPGWWWGYPGYPCYPYYGWWCGGYPPYYGGGWVVYQYTTGALVMELIDTDRSENANLPVIVWTAAMSSVVSSDATTNTDIGVTNINQAFKQSPYLQ